MVGQAVVGIGTLILVLTPTCLPMVFCIARLDMVSNHILAIALTTAGVITGEVTVHTGVAGELFTQVILAAISGGVTARLRGSTR